MSDEFENLMTKTLKSCNTEEFSINSEFSVGARNVFNWINQRPLLEDVNSFHDNVAIDLIDNLLTLWTDDPGKTAKFIDSTETILRIYFTESSYKRLEKVCGFLKSYWLSEMTL